MIKIYEFAVSGNCYKVRLMLSLLGLDYLRLAVNGPQLEHKSSEFLQLNPFGQVPVLVDGDLVLRDSQAILVYLARQYGGDDWWPDNAVQLAQISSWLATAANEVARGPNALRLHYRFGRAIQLDDAEQISQKLLGILNDRFKQQPWLATDRVSIADIALYPYLVLAPEAKLDLSPYPAVLAWLHRVQNLPGYIEMSDKTV